MRPLSVIDGRDGIAIQTLLEIHSAVALPRILDVTYSQGVMWKGTGIVPVRMDINPELDLDVIGDFASMPFDDSSFDVIVFDPPHLPTTAVSEHSSISWKARYGITAEGVGRDGDNVSGMFLPFLQEARRVLTVGGIVLAKLADLVHNHRYQWQQVDFINAVREAGMTPCDMMIAVNGARGNLKSSKWQQVKHVRKAHCYWIVVRNSDSCECSREGMRIVAPASTQLSLFEYVPDYKEYGCTYD